MLGGSLEMWKKSWRFCCSLQESRNICYNPLELWLVCKAWKLRVCWTVNDSVGGSARSMESLKILESRGESVRVFESVRVLKNLTERKSVTDNM